MELLPVKLWNFSKNLRHNITKCYATIDWVIFRSDNRNNFILLFQNGLGLGRKHIEADISSSRNYIKIITII